MSNATILSKSALWETIFGGTKAVRQFVFYAGTTVDADRKPIYDRCVIGYGENEWHARVNAEAVLYGRLGHNGYHLGDIIPMV